jgi:hypothetical protein
MQLCDPLHNHDLDVSGKMVESSNEESVTEEEDETPDSESQFEDTTRPQDTSRIVAPRPTVVEPSFPTIATPRNGKTTLIRLYNRSKIDPEDRRCSSVIMSSYTLLCALSYSTNRAVYLCQAAGR